MGANAGLMMGIATGAQGVGAMAGAIGQSHSLKVQGEVQQKLYDMNVRMAEYQAKDTLRMGERAVDLHRQKTKSLIGTQRVNLAAQGIDLESGSALDIQNNTKYMSELDVMTIKNNAWRQAWGFKMDALSSSFRGEVARMSGNNAGRNTLLTGILDSTTYGMKGYYYANQPATKAPQDLVLWDT